MSKGRVLVAMSGGIDSSIAAILLQQEGYEIIGMTMKTWDYAASGGSKKETGCCSLDSIHDAMGVAVNFGFPHYVVDIRPEFGEQVIDNFVSEYIAGRTPNPCILCNTHIKWESLLQKAIQLNCSHIATGHYARIGQVGDRLHIKKGIDLNKDQSYALWGLSQESLKKSLFPLGELTKSQVRKVAIDLGYEALAKKSESYEICFIPDNDYRGFLKRKVNGLEERLEGGLFVSTEGEVLGKHKGYPFYTIGQRKGLGIALGYPVYVARIIREENKVVLGSLSNLARSGMIVKNPNWMKYEKISQQGQEMCVKIRYNNEGADAIVKSVGEDIEVIFNSPVFAIAPGQSAVFYEQDDVVGGGLIEKSFDVFESPEASVEIINQTTIEQQIS